MTSVEAGLGAVIVSLISGAIGSRVGSHGKVDCETCLERRNSCMALMSEKFGNLEKKLDEISKKLDPKE